MLTVSDNDVAEALLRQVAVADGRPATFDGGAAAVRDVLGKLGLDLAGYKVLDGSGLSRQDRVAPEFLVRFALASATDHPDLRAAVTGLPVAGFTGTLAEDGRFQSPDSSAGAGLVRAKTGSLTGVATLAGVVRDKDGQLLLFALMADKVSDETAARTALDRLAAGISGCGCGTPERPASPPARRPHPRRRPRRPRPRRPPSRRCRRAGRRGREAAGVGPDPTSSARDVRGRRRHPDAGDSASGLGGGARPGRGRPPTPPPGPAGRVADGPDPENRRRPPPGPGPGPTRPRPRSPSAAPSAAQSHVA